MRFGVLGIFALLLIGCGDQKPSNDVAAPSAGPVSMASPQAPAEPADAKQVAKEIGFPLLSDPLKTALATKQDKGNGEVRYEIQQVVKRAPKDAATFYSKHLHLEMNDDGGVYDLKGETLDHMFVLMAIKSVDGKTAIGATFLKMTAQ